MSYIRGIKLNPVSNKVFLWVEDVFFQLQNDFIPSYFCCSSKCFKADILCGLSSLMCY